MTPCFSPLCQTELVCLLPPGYSSSRQPVSLQQRASRASLASSLRLGYCFCLLQWSEIRFKLKATQYFSASSLAVSIGPRRGSAQRSDRAWSTEEMRPVKTPLTVRHSAHISLSSRPIGNGRRDEPYQNTCRGPGVSTGKERVNGREGKRDTRIKNAKFKKT